MSSRYASARKRQRYKRKGRLQDRKRKTWAGKKEFFKTYNAGEEMESRAITRFSELPQEMKWWKHRSVARRKYTTEQVTNAILLCSQMPMSKVSEATGIPEGSLHAWYYRRKLPKTGPWCFANVMKLIRAAKEIYDGRDLYANRQKRVMWCMRKALWNCGMSYRMFRVYLKFEAIPTVPGFPLYADPASQQRAEECGLGLRVSPNPTFGPTVCPQPKRPVADTPAPAPAPLASSPSDGSNFHLAKQRLRLKGGLADKVAALRQQGLSQGSLRD